MYTDENDFRTPRERVDDDMLRRMLGGDMRQQKNHSNRPCDNSSEKRHSWGLEDYPLAMVYSPIQNWRGLYDNETALRRGTLFKELDMPFLGSDGMKNGTGGCCRG